MAAPAAMFQGVFSASTGIVGGLSVPQGTGAGCAVTGSIVKNGFSATSTYHIIKDAQELESAFNLDASLGVNAQLASVKGKIDFLKAVDLSESQCQLMIIVEATQCESSAGTQFSPAPNVQHVNEWLSGHKVTDRTGFLAEYGDCFVSKMAQGGIYTGYYRMTCKTLTDRDTAIGQISGSASGLSGSLDGSLSSKIQNIASNYALNVDCHQYVVGTTADQGSDLVAFALKFQSMALDNPAIISFDASPYEFAGFQFA